MKTLALLLSFMACVPPALASRRVNVKQLDQILMTAKSHPDQEVSRTLAGLELTERLSTRSLQHWKDAVPGAQSWQALTALADASAFLKLPSDEISRVAPLNQDAQSRLLSLASENVEKILSKLPDFFATETITTFEDTPPSRNGSEFTSYQPLHYADLVRANVYYRGGKEVMETHQGAVVEKDQTIAPSSGLLSSGEFGPILKSALSDAQSGKLVWSHWEKADSGPIAVFRYAVTEGKSHYRVKLLIPGYSVHGFQTRPGYQGEIAIDPTNGEILRITLKADFGRDDPVTSANLVVEYGHVEIGSMRYLCPVKSVAVVLAYQQLEQLGGVTARPGGLSQRLTSVNGADAPLQTLVNDVAFSNYHLLRSEARVLTGADIDDDGNSP